MSNSIHFSAIRFGANVVYDTNLNAVTPSTVVFKNTLGINTASTDTDYTLYIEGDTKVIGSVTTSNLVYGSSNLNNIVVNQLDLQQKASLPLIETPAFAFQRSGYLSIQNNQINKHLAVAGTVVASNIQFIGDTPVHGSNIYSKQIQETFYVATNTSNFQLYIPGNYSLIGEPQVFFNGFHLSYSNETSNDYSYSSNYNGLTDQTEVNITIAPYVPVTPFPPSNIIDIVLSPNYSTDDYSTLLLQRVKLGVWSSNDYLFTSNTVGIATNTLLSPAHALEVKTLYTSQLITPEFTTQDLVQDILTSSNVVNETTTYASNLTIPQSNLYITGDVYASAIYLSNISLQTGFTLSPTTINIATNSQLNSSNYIATAIGIGTISPLQALQVNGSISSLQLLKSSAPYTIPSNWSSNLPQQIYYPTNVAINTIPIVTTAPNLYVQGNVITSNLTPLPTTITNTARFSTPSFVGMISYFAGNQPQPGWLECNGAYVSSNQYPALYDYLQTTYGALSNEFFKLPDLRGEFVRSYGPGRNVGTLQTAALEQHSHNWSFGTRTININSTVTSNTFALVAGVTSNAITTPLHAIVANETRPRNVSLLPCILY